MSKKRICLLAVGLTLLLAAGFFLALPRTLFDEPFSATVWSRDGRLLSAKVAPDGQWRFFPTDSVPGKFRTAITTYEDKRFDRHFGTYVQIQGNVWHNAPKLLIRYSCLGKDPGKNG